MSRIIVCFAIFSVSMKELVPPSQDSQWFISNRLHPHLLYMIQITYVQLQLATGRWILYFIEKGCLEKLNTLGFGQKYYYK